MDTKSILPVLIAVACATCLLAASADDREARWHEDLAFLLAQLSAKGETVDLKRGVSSRGQKDYDKLYPHFGDDIRALEAEMRSLTDAQITARLMRLIAAPNVAHNTVILPIGEGQIAQIPINTEWFADGLAIVATSDRYTDAVGTYIRKYGDKAPEEVLRSVAPYIAHENDSWLRAESPRFLRSLMLLNEAGVNNSDGQVTLTLQKPGGPLYTLPVKAVTAMVPAHDVDELLKPPRALYRSQPGIWYWDRYLDDSGTLYIQYNVCEDDPKHPFGEFTKRVLADADTHNIRRVVIDLRGNEGGSSRVIHPLVTGLEHRSGKLGPVFALIGPHTFSSGTDAADEIQRTLHATLAGEPTGGKPSSYGEVKFIDLPHSKLEIRYTSKYFGSGDARGSFEPAIPVATTFEDFLAGRDPVLEAVIRN